MELGINTFFIDVDEAHQLGLDRVEIVTQSRQKALEDTEKARRNSMKYSVHLPVFLPSWYSCGQWDVYFCDTDPKKRELSFRLLEENLEFVAELDAEYVITHFSGILPQLPDDKLDLFSDIAANSASRIESLASKYNVQILLEYFGLNKNLVHPDEWTSLVSGSDNLGLLVDTGHLYFSCINNNLNIDHALQSLGTQASAFHIWNTKDKDHYWKYHHVAPHSSQSVNDGWAYTTYSLVESLNFINPSAPLIIEPNVLFGGREYILDSIYDMKNILEKLKSQPIISEYSL